MLVQCDDYVLRRAAGDHHASAEEQMNGAVENVTLEVRTPGQLATLAFRPARRVAPGDGEVEIEVRAAGLNFIEVLFALGMLPNPVGGRFPLGQECAGVVTRAGAGTRFQPGDEVIAYGKSCFAMQAVVPERCVALKPPGLSYAEAAGLPAAYLTAWYSLIHLARLRPGERVLIHAAAGGVGLAAVHLAQWRGAEIFATAGSEAKREYLRGLGIRHVLSSRTLDFAAEVRRATADQGVDVVLNSLGGEFIPASLNLLRRHGRLLELGKRDLFRGTPVGLDAFARFIAFFAVDVAPDLPGFAELWGELTAHLHAGTFPPLPHQAFPAAAAHEAFEHMAQARHIGKVILDFSDHSALLAPARAGRSGRPEWRDGSPLASALSRPRWRKAVGCGLGRRCWAPAR